MIIIKWLVFWLELRESSITPSKLALVFDFFFKHFLKFIFNVKIKVFYFMI